jgi:isopentenyl diphosphate isomerase/L-lactate dehydrogenase-like FMN-dependent dehydrogenase
VAAAGYDTLILTVDTAVGGIRLRDVRNGLTIPPRLSARTMAQMALYPRWWANLLTTAPLEFASLSTTGGTVGDLLTDVFDPTIGPEHVAWLRSIWPGTVMLKGVQSVDDARIAATSRSSCCPTWSPPSAIASRCTSMAASPVAPTSWRPWPSVRAAP